MYDLSWQKKNDHIVFIIGSNVPNGKFGSNCAHVAVEMRLGQDKSSTETYVSVCKFNDTSNPPIQTIATKRIDEFNELQRYRNATEIADKIREKVNTYGDEWYAKFLSSEEYTHRIESFKMAINNKLGELR